MYSKVFLAPLAGLTDLSFRLQCQSYGAGLVVTPMINCNAIVRANKATIKLLKTIPDEKPKAVQLFGSKTDVIAKAVKIVREHTNCDIIDFNMGCPDKNIISQGAGAALLKRPTKIIEIVKTLKRSVDVPVSIKIRLGGSEKSLNYLQNSKIIQEAGADFLGVHARTIAQGYSGKANWDAIREIKQNLTIPVIGNGDIWDEESAKKMFEYTGCDYIMVGRGALGKPYIFEQINHYLSTGNKLNKIYDFKKLFFDYLETAKKYNDLEYTRLKQHAMFFTKGIDNSTEIRKKITHIKDMTYLIEFFKKL